MELSIRRTLSTSSSFYTRHASPRARLWTARIVRALAVLMLTMDTTLKVFQLASALEANRELGFPAAAFTAIGWVELACLIVYLVPRTAPLGAVLWTGYLGGAIATHLRLGHALFSHTLFPIYIAVALWLPLWLCDERVGRLLDQE